MSKVSRRSVAGLAAVSLGLGGAIVGAGAPQIAFAQEECTAGDTSIDLLAVNDFHGRVAEAEDGELTNALAARLFTVVEDVRAEQGEDNVLLLSSGDQIGGSTFISAVADDQPTLDVFNAAGVEASAAGNHEFDKGWDDLAGRVIPAADYPFLAANVYAAGAEETTENVAEPLGSYEIIEKGGVSVAVVGAVTGDLPSLVSPAGIEDLDIGDPVEAVNRVAAELSDGDEGNGEADIVVASYHEGAANGSTSAEENATEGSPFANIYNNTSDDVDVVFNSHTHQVYDWTLPGGQPLLSGGEYAENLSQVTLSVDSEAGAICGYESAVVPAADEANDEYPRIQEINTIVDAAIDEAAELGSQVIGEADVAISTPGNGGSGVRDQESPMNNMVAQMFKDMIGPDNDEFIGIQNPGGTRTSFDAGPVTYEEAALVLPFANSLFTTELTGAQFKEVLEQQWQRDADGNVPSRPYLALGLSDNVSYTYDATREEGDRITSINVNGAPIGEETLYTVGSGSFLISGGDNFHAFADGANTADAGFVDLTAWVEWIGEQGALNPDYSKRGIDVDGADHVVRKGRAPLTLTLGQPAESGANPQNLDMFLDVEGEAVSPQLPNETVTASLDGAVVGTGEVNDGVGSIEVQLAADSDVVLGQHELTLEIEPSGTIARVPVDVRSSLTAASASAKMVGQETSLWGSGPGYEGETVVAEAAIGDDWVEVGSSTIGEDGSYVIALGDAVAEAGEYELRARVGDVASGTTTLVRVPRSSFGAAPVAIAGRSTNVWGTTADAATVTTQVNIPGRGWTSSQTREAEGGEMFVVPLTYRQEIAGEYQWRVIVNHVSGATEVLGPFTQTRLAVPTNASAGRAPVGRTANVWGSADVEGATRVWTEVHIEGRGWVRSQQGTTNAQGGYVLPLTYGKDTAGTYRFRVGAEYPGFGKVYSNGFDFVRTR